MNKNKMLIYFLFTLTLLLVSPLPALAETKTFQVTQDTYSNSAPAYQDKNYSASSVVISNKFTTRLGFFDFENVEIPEGAILDRGILKFYIKGHHYSEDTKLNIGPIGNNWAENHLTWNNIPLIVQDQAVEEEVSLATGWKESSITHIVRQWLDKSLEEKGIFIYSYGYLYGSPTNKHAFEISSKEVGGYPAKLEVEYHFEPSPSPLALPSPAPLSQAETDPIQKETEKDFTPPILETSPTPSPETEGEKHFILKFSLTEALTTGLIILVLIVITLVLIILRIERQNAKKLKEKGEEETEKKEETQKEKPKKKAKPKEKK